MALVNNDKVWSRMENPPGMGRNITECIQLCMLASKNNSEEECRNACLGGKFTSRAGSPTIGRKTASLGLSGTLTKNPNWRKLDQYTCAWTAINANNVPKPPPMSQEASELFEWCRQGRTLVGGSGAGANTQSGMSIAPKQVGVSGIDLGFLNALYADPVISPVVGAGIGYGIGRDVKSLMIGLLAGAAVSQYVGNMACNNIANLQKMQKSFEKSFNQ